jgi:hypothetical protein
MSQPSDLTEALGRARVLALKAFEMDPQLPEAHDILALINDEMIDPLTASDVGEPMTEVHVVRMSPPENLEGDVAVGAPDSVTVISVDAALAASSGDFRRDSTSIFESYTRVGNQLRTAMDGWARQTGRMASVDPVRMVAVAQRLKTAGRTDDAAEILLAVCERSPEHEEAWEALELLHASNGEYGQILDLRRLWVDHAGGDAESVDQLENQLRSEGAEGYWEWRLGVLQRRVSDGEDVSRVYLAAAQAALGNTDQAMAALQVAARDRDQRLTSLRTDAVWDVLRPDPRFSALLRRIANPPPSRRARREN